MIRLPARAIRVLLAALALLPLAAGAGSAQDILGAIKQYGSQSGAAGALSQSEIVTGLRQALAQGTTRAINTLGQADGYWSNAQVRVPLPENLARAEKTLRKLGGGARVDQFHQTLNRAAEQAVPQVADIFGNAVRAMTIEDVRAVLNGSPDAATQFFRRTTGDSIRARFLPLVQAATAKVGVTQQYKSLAGKYGTLLSMAGYQPVELDGYVTQKAMDGLFTVVAQEEARIRADPAARGSEILRRVFGARKP